MLTSKTSKLCSVHLRIMMVSAELKWLVNEGLGRPNAKLQELSVALARYGTAAEHFSLQSSVLNDQR